MLHGTSNGIPFHRSFFYPEPDTWIAMFPGIVIPWVKFYGTGYGGVDESRSVLQRQPHLTVSPSVVTGQMAIRLQAVGTSRPIVQIQDAVGNLVRSVDCIAGSDGIAAATWNREDKYGRLVPEGIYFCRYAASDVISVRKVLVAR